MNEEREMVLRMLKEGKISVEEADALLHELAQQGAEARGGDAEGARPSSTSTADLRDELRVVLQDLMESFRRDVVPELRRTKEAFHPTFVQVLRGLRGLVEGRAETAAEERMAAGETLELRNAWGDVHISASADDRVRLRAVKRVWASTSEEAQAEAEALAVVVRREGAIVLISVSRPEGRRARVDFEIAVPMGVATRVDVAKGDLTIRRVQGDVRLDVKSGDVTLDEVGRIEGRVISGDVAVNGCRGAALDVMNGDVSLTQVAGDVDVAAKSGDVAIAEARSREVRVRTLSGDVAIDLLELQEGSVLAETLSGDIRLALPSDARATVEAGTRSGDVRSGLPLTEQVTGLRSLRGVLNGGGATVRLQATSGDVRLEARR